MNRFFEKILKVYDREIGKFLWMAAFFFLIFLSMAIFRNYVDATFLKRYGAEQIPLMLLINGALTIVSFWLIGVFFRDLGDCQLVAGFMILCALLTGALFFMVLDGSSIAYPILYQILNLQDSFFLVYLWNIAGDLFDVRQGKRIFPLIMAGQVLGTTVGSFAVAPLAKITGYDSLLIVVSLAYILIGVGLFYSVSHFLPSVGIKRKEAERVNKKFSEIISIAREYPIIRYLMVTTFFPNILLPVFTYQFSLIAQDTFLSEQGLLTFLGVFRGATTLVIFLLLFIVGRFYTKIGIVNASFLHPLNFVAVFGGLSAFFNIFIAAYGQFSILFIQRAIASPINKTLFNVAPERIIKWSRIFISGTVINVSVIVSAFAMIFLQKVMHARDMALIAVVIAMYWAYETYRFKKRYAVGLKQTLTHRSIDYGRMEAEQAIVHTSPHMEVNAGLFDQQRNLSERLDEHIDLNADRALKLLDDPDERIRTQAASFFSRDPDVRAINRLIRKLTDGEMVRKAAIEALASYGNEIEPSFQLALMTGPWRVKQGILEAIRFSGRREFPFLDFIGREATAVYNNLVIIEALSTEGSSLSTDMLRTHLMEKNEELLRIIFHALWIRHADIRLIYESLRTDKASVAVELLEASLDPSVSRLLMPLIDTIPVREKIAKGRSSLLLMESEGMNHTLPLLGDSADPVTRMLAVYAIGEYRPEWGFYPTVERLLDDPEENIRQVAAYAMKRMKKEEAAMPEIIFDINVLKNTALFEGVSIRAMQAIAPLIKQRFYKAGDVVIKEGDEVLFLYCIINGKMHAFRGYGNADQQFIRILANGDILGELPLFTKSLSKETYAVVSDFIEFYVFEHQSFLEIMNLHPQIGINMSRIIAARLEGS